MTAPLLATKLFVPPPRPGIVPRPRLIERLNEGCAQGCKLTLISAPAGFGKTTLVSEWISTLHPSHLLTKHPRRGQGEEPGETSRSGVRIAWVSLDERDNDPARFISYLVKALQTIQAGIGEGLLAALQSPQPLQIETILNTLLNEISTIPGNFLLVLDDYHLIDSQPVDQSLAFLIEHQPLQMHLVIATREDPSLPLARLRGRGQCTELRAADLRFTPAEAAEFLNQGMGLELSAENISALEARTEGWIAGLQLAAISMRGHQDAAGFIQSFTGSHRFVLDYLLEEVLQRQSAEVQNFLLRTSILERLCGPLCDAILRAPAGSGDETLKTIERANLFIVPLDNERRWYRYHHLFGDLLRKRLGQSQPPDGIAGLQLHASEWYENNDLMLDAFRHAAAANDIERAIRLMESRKMPLHRRGTATTILSWLESLPKSWLDARPVLWWMQAAMLLIIGQPLGVEEKLQAMEAAMALAARPDAGLDEPTRDLIGKIAAARANVAQLDPQKDTIQVQTHRALEYLHPDNLSFRSMAIRSLGFSYYMQGDLAEAGRAYAEAYSLAQAAGDTIESSLASLRLGQVQEAENQLHLAAETYLGILPVIDEYSPHNAPVAYLGLTRIHYEWNDLDAAEHYGELSLQLARQYDQLVDRLVLSEVFLAHLKLARGDATGAMDELLQAEQTSHQKNYTYRMPDITYNRAGIQLSLGNVDEAAQLVQQYAMPLMQARVLVAQGNPSEALALVETQRQQAEAKRLPQRLLLVKAVQSVVLFANGEKDQAMQVLAEVLALAEPESFIRLFVDEGEPMRLLIADFRSWIEKRALADGSNLPGYTDKLLAAFAPKVVMPQSKTLAPHASAGVGNQKSTMLDPLSQRELEVLQLVAQGLSNEEICQRLFLALDTVKGHNRRIFEKLQVKRRTEAIARARELGLI